MVLKFECPRCGKGERSEVVEIIGERKYRMKCEDCECTYILTANVEEEKKSDSLGGD